MVYGISHFKRKSEKQTRCVLFNSFVGHGLSMFVRILKAEYNKRSLLKPLPWENTVKLPLEDVYTRLSIVSRKKTDFQLETGEVNMYDIFKTLDKGEDAMVLVEGSPGIGKTTFCLKISHDWTNEKIPNDFCFPVFELVLLLKCRDIHGDIMEAINEQLLPEDTDEKVRKKIMDYIKDIHNQEKILIILDGLDELPKTAETHVDKLLHRRILPFCYVLATSRQERGIAVRQDVNFAILFQIEGFTDQDAFEYIRKHFSHSGSRNLSKGERLIESIQENSFLHAMPNNPLNLLLLCVVFEDYQGELPSFRTELYQIIIRCLLRRYCAKHNLKAPGDDQALETQFENSLLVLGELAWRCLLEDRFSFREDELAKFESKIKDLAARKLGLVFKEASIKKINPQHEYFFFHKTFQEYLAAAYLAHKLLREGVNVFCEFQLDFEEHVTNKYRQVFLFVSGILSKDASVLFKQIGEKLASEDWVWLRCSKEEATFFTESFFESQNAEQMAMTLCSFIPFPITAKITVRDEDTPETANMLMVAEACRNFLQLQHPVHLTIKVVHGYDLPDEDQEMVAKFLVTCPKLQTFSFHLSSDLSLLIPVTTLFEGLSGNSTISSFTFRGTASISSDWAFMIGNSLAAAHKTLTTVTFELINECDEAWASALERGLSADTPLTSIVLKIYSSLSAEALGALKKVLSNRSLSTLTLIIYCEMQDSLATSLGETLVAESILKSFTLISYGKVSYSAAISLERGFLENSALTSLEVKVFGELPDNWATVAEKVVEAKRTKMSVTFHPNITGTLSKAQVARLYPGFELQSLTLNLWGELSSAGADTLCNLLLTSSTSCITLNIHGKVTESVAECLVRYLKPCKTLSKLSINIWGELTRAGNSAFQELRLNGEYLFAFKVCSVASDSWICKDLNDKSNVSSSVQYNCARISNRGFSGLDWARYRPDSLAKYTSLATLTLTLDNCSDLSGDWARGLGDRLTKNTSLTTLSLTFDNNGDLSGDGARALGDFLAKNTSLSTLSLTFKNYGDLSGDWARGLGDGLAKNKSLTTLSLTFNNYGDLSGDGTRGLGDGLAKNTSLTTLSLTFDNYGDLSGDWTRGLGDGLAKNKSLTTPRLTFNNYGDVSGDWARGLGDGLAKNKSLTTLSITFNYYGGLSGDGARGLGDGLAKNTSLTTLSLTFDDCRDLSGDCARCLGDGLAKNTSLTTLSLTFKGCVSLSGNGAPGLGDGLGKNASLTTLSLTFDNFGHLSGDWARGLGDGLAKNTSLTTLSLTFDNGGDLSADGASGLGDGLAKNASLTTLSLTFKRYVGLSGYGARGLGDGLGKNASLTTLSLTFDNDGDLSGDWTRGVGDGLAKNTSLTTLSITFNNYGDLSGDMSGDWARGLGDGLAKNTSLTTLSITFNNYGDLSGDMSGDWARGLGDGLAKNTSLTTLSITFNNYGDLSGDMSGDWARGLGDGLAKNTSLTTLSITFNNYRDLSGDCARGLGDGLAKNMLLTTLRLAFDDHSYLSGDWARGLGDGLAKNKSLTTLRLTFNNYGDVSGDWARGLGDGLAKNKSLTTLSLTFNNYEDVSGDWARGLGDGLAKNKSLTTLSLTFNNYGDVSGDWARGLGDGLGKSTSLTTLSLTFNNYGDLSGDGARGLGDGLAKNTSLTTLSLTMNNYSDLSGDWPLDLGDNLGRSKSLTVVNLTLTSSYLKMSEEWLCGLCNSLAGSATIIAVNITFNDHSGTSEVCYLDLREQFADCKSSPSLNLTVSLYGEAVLS